MTIGEVAAIPKVTDRTTHRLDGAKKTPSLKVVGGRRFSKADIDRWTQPQSVVDSTDVDFQRK